MDTVASSQMKLVSKALRDVRKRASSAPATLRSPNIKPPKVKTELKLKKNSDIDTNIRINKPNKVSPNKATFERLAERHTKLSMMRHASSRKIAAQRNGVRGVLRASSTSAIKGRPTALERWKSAPNIIRVHEIITIEEESVCVQSVISVGPQLEVGSASRVDVFTTNTLRPEDEFDQVDCLEPVLDGCLAECEAGGTKRREKVITKEKVTIMGKFKILRGISSLFTTCAKYMLKLTVLFVGKEFVFGL